MSKNAFYLADNDRRGNGQEMHIYGLLGLFKRCALKYELYVLVSRE